MSSLINVKLITLILTWKNVIKTIQNPIWIWHLRIILCAVFFIFLFIQTRDLYIFCFSNLKYLKQNMNNFSKKSWLFYTMIINSLININNGCINQFVVLFKVSPLISLYWCNLECINNSNCHCNSII